MRVWLLPLPVPGGKSPKPGGKGPCSALLTRQEQCLLVDVAPAIYNKGWHLLNDDLDDNGPGSIMLEDPAWVTLETSHAGSEFKVFHDLSEEMYHITGQCVHFFHIFSWTRLIVVQTLCPGLLHP